MKIGFLSHWFDPEGGAAAGPGTIARELRDRGHDVHVVTGYPIYPSGRVYPEYRQRPYMREVIDDVTVHRSPIYPSHDQRAAHRMANYLSYAATGALTAQRVLASVDAAFVYSTPATAALPALGLKWLRRIPFVVQIQDIWPQTVTASQFVEGDQSGLIERVLNVYCDQVYRSAHSVAVTSPGMTDLVRRRGVPATKIHLVPNWAEEHSFYPKAAAADVATQIGPGRPFTVMYAGNFGEMQDLVSVVRAAALLQDVSDIEFVLVGGGTDERRLRAEVDELQLDNVRFVGPYPFTEMADVLATGDVQLVTLKDQPLFRATLPSKIQANLAAGRPIIGAAAGDVADVLRRSGAGLVVPPGDHLALASAVRQLHAEGADALARRSTLARKYYLENFSTQIVGDRLEALLVDAAEEYRHDR